MNLCIIRTGDVKLSAGHGSHLLRCNEFIGLKGHARPHFVLCYHPQLICCFLCWIKYCMNFAKSCLLKETMYSICSIYSLVFSLFSLWCVLVSLSPDIISMNFITSRTRLLIDRGHSWQHTLYIPTYLFIHSVVLCCGPSVSSTHSPSPVR